MTQWFRRARAGQGTVDEDMPATPGGSGGSGFGSVGDPLPGRSGESPAGERRESVASRTRRPAATPPAVPTGTGRPEAGRGRGADGGDEPGRRGLGRFSSSESAEERRFSRVYAEDRVAPMPYPNQASPDVAAARGRVRSLVDGLLPHGVDEGSGGALDPLIASWASSWLARIDSEHADHHAVIDRLIGGARRQLAEAEAAHERDERALTVAQQDYDDARTRLMEPVSSPADESGRSRPRGSWLDRFGPGARRTRPGGRDDRAAPSGGVPPTGGASTAGSSGSGAGTGPSPAGRPPSDPPTNPVPVRPPSYGTTFSGSVAGHAPTAPPTGPAPTAPGGQAVHQPPTPPAPAPGRSAADQGADPAAGAGPGAPAPRREGPPAGAASGGRARHSRPEDGPPPSSVGVDERGAGR